MNGNPCTSIQIASYSTIKYFYKSYHLVLTYYTDVLWFERDSVQFQETSFVQIVNASKSIRPVNRQTCSSGGTFPCNFFLLLYIVASPLAICYLKSAAWRLLKSPTKRLTTEVKQEICLPCRRFINRGYGNMFVYMLAGMNNPDLLARRVLNIKMITSVSSCGIVLWVNKFHEFHRGESKHSLHRDGIVFLIVVKQLMAIYFDCLLCIFMNKAIRYGGSCPQNVLI